MPHRVIDEGVETCTVEPHAHRVQHFARSLGEGAQCCMRAVVSIPERCGDKARELRPIGLEADLCVHGAPRGRALTPFMEDGRAIPLRSGVVFTRRPGWS